MPRTPKTTAPATYRVRIRMYRQGLGDCFLLSFRPAQGNEVHVLIDCGVVLGTGEPAAVMKRVAQDVAKATGGTLDVLIITHEHWDHLSAFDAKQAREMFAKMKINKLWLAWTEDDTDSLAQRLRRERERKKAAAKTAKERIKQLGFADRAGRMAEILGMFGARDAGDQDALADDGGGTAGALAFLKKQCPPTIIETGQSYTVPGLEGVRVYVAGPPKDKAAMNQTDPYKGEGYGLADQTIGLADAFLAGFDPADETAQPFVKGVRRPLAALKRTRKSKKTDLLPGIAGYYAAASAWRNIDDDWLATGERLALQLDNATNNTSLVLAFEFEDGDVLLFVGDAQAGNWRSWESLTWKVKTNDGEAREVSSADLLNRTIFYKVGHHGSHNATLRTNGLELMKSGRLAAVIPVDTNVAHDVKGWEHMPLPAIRERLEQKCAVIFQSDMDAKEIRKVPGTHWENSSETFDVRMKDKKTKSMKTVRQQPLYTDYFV